MYKYLMKGDVDTWQNTLHGMDCIECGACTYICPARLPLIHAFRMGKQKVNNARMAAKAKAEAEGRCREEGGVSNDGLQKFEADRILLSPISAPRITPGASCWMSSSPCCPLWS